MKMNNNILFIIYDLERAGPELRLLDLAKYLPDNLKIHICVTSNNLELMDEFSKYGIPIIVVPIAKPYLELKNIIAIYKYVIRKKIYVLNSFDLKGLLILIFIKLMIRKQIITVFHNVNSLRNYNRKQRLLFKLLGRFIDKCVCNSKYSRHEIENRYIRKRKIDLIYNGIDTSYFKKDVEHSIYTRQIMNIDSNDVIIGTIANFRPQKNYPFLIDAFNTLLTEFPFLRLICIGGGPYLETVQDIVKKYALENEIIFTGYSDDVKQYLSIMDIFVLCSKWEGLPNVILQAMSIGVPVVCSSVGGCPEMIENRETGILFPSNDKTRFIEAVEKLIKDKTFSKQIVHNANIQLESRFNLNTMINMYYSLFNRPIE